MAIERFLQGRSFAPETAAAIREAFEEVLKALDIGPHEQGKRAAVAWTTVRIASDGGSLDAANLRDRTIKALSVHKGK
jgi:hypothetical protein